MIIKITIYYSYLFSLNDKHTNGETNTDTISPSIRIVLKPISFLQSVHLRENSVINCVEEKFVSSSDLFDSWK